MHSVNVIIHYLGIRADEPCVRWNDETLGLVEDLLAILYGRQDVTFELLEPMV